MNDLNKNIFTPDIVYTSQAYMQAHTFEVEHCPVFCKLASICDLSYEMDRFGDNSFKIQLHGDHDDKILAVSTFIEMLKNGFCTAGSLLYWFDDGSMISQRLKVKDEERFPYDEVPVCVMMKFPVLSKQFQSQI